ncbi:MULTISPECIES: hypothetical protein [unclassified Serratia (in: enterobacteria)]|uniref:hypothetical protein n=1 Tax=unclassified Serratia (in: enterobacteria) TaxID=2647522 RepID=UPI000502FECC|nr:MULTISPECIES: hypothetical protein [unclassified Serratia (in: enterobacteria)]KFK95340.1 hypothetical protein JV45_08250 [Serratia sp. Ag2]KFK98688.1 hypothetical protein IV04_10955 [Serratia sp. Ag1]
MQVGLKTIPSSTSAALTGGRLEAPQSVQQRKIVKTPEARNPFPEAALISTRPLRYNVQLNRQITAVQQADNYLAETESQLLQLRHTGLRGDKTAKTVKLQRLLDQRTELSGGTVDRHFNVTLEKKTQVNFGLAISEQLIENPQGETLIFALGGNKRELTAVVLPEEGSPRQVLAQLNVGLGRMGIHARQDSVGQVIFSVDESRWGRVSQHLSVRGEGRNFPADSFTLLAAQPEQAQDEGLARIAARSDNPRDTTLQMQNALERITTQRGKLRMHQERVVARINDMATPYTPQQAQDTAQALGNVLENSAANYADLSRALGAQANIRLATVKNLLG